MTKNPHAVALGKKGGESTSPRKAAELKSDERRVALGGGNFIHEISAWSGRHEDESPICGSTSIARTVVTSHVTCPDCLLMRERWADMHDEAMR